MVEESLQLEKKFDPQSTDNEIKTKSNVSHDITIQSNETDDEKMISCSQSNLNQLKHPRTEVQPFVRTLDLHGQPAYCN